MNLSGSPFDYLLVFMGGMALSFTPCVYPLIPVTVSAIGITSGGSRWRGLVLSLVYVTGMALTYSLLGIAASLTGKLFGSISAHPAVRLLVGVVFFLSGLSMLNVFRIALPGIVSARRPGKNDYFSVFALGLMSGFAASPCVAPALGAILVYIGATHNVFYGMTLLMAFAYGIGLMLIVVGTFGSMIRGLPKSGKWMVGVERFFAAVMLVIGAYYIYESIGRFRP